jgi:hypothetical protein
LLRPSPYPALGAASISAADSAAVSRSTTTALSALPASSSLPAHERVTSQIGEPELPSASLVVVDDRTVANLMDGLDDDDFGAF